MGKLLAPRAAPRGLVQQSARPSALWSPVWAHTRGMGPKPRDEMKWGLQGPGLELPVGSGSCSLLPWLLTGWWGLVSFQSGVLSVGEKQQPATGRSLLDLSVCTLFAGRSCRSVLRLGSDPCVC